MSSSTDPDRRDPDEPARFLAAEALADADPTGWFERLYAAAAAGDAVVPWDSADPHALLVDWAQAEQPVGRGRRALVVGCGLGRDAEYVAGLGFDTVGFDISATAVESARARHPGSRVDYRTGDLFDPPAEWSRAFDLVVESMTVQSLPESLHAPAIANVARFVGVRGRLLVIAFGGVDGGPVEGPPWPLRRDEVDAFASDGLVATRVEDLPDPTRTPIVHRWRAEFHRAPSAEPDR